MEKAHINDIQTETVDEHFKLLLEDNSVIDSEANDVTPNDLPEWYNDALYKEAQNFYRRNRLSIVAVATVGLVLVFSVTTILKILIYTKRSNSVQKSFKRYVETMLHIHNLSMHDPYDEDSKWYKTMNMIRWNHKTASKRAKNAGIGEITQRDMVLTQYGFVGFVFIAPRVFGLCNTLVEEEAFNHFWRVNGYMLGISDRLNLCRKNAKETTKLCHKIKDLYATYLRETSSEFYKIASYSLDAIWYVDITVDKNSFLAFTFKLHDLPYKIGWYSWLNMKYREWIFNLFHVPYVRVIARMYGNYLIRFILWTAEYYPLLAWIKFGKDNVKLNVP